MSREDNICYQALRSKLKKKKALVACTVACAVGELGLISGGFFNSNTDASF
jgi:hypothetical protein